MLPPVRLELAAVPRDFRMRGHAHSAPHLCVVLSGGASERHNGRSREWGGNWVRVSGPESEHDLRVPGAPAQFLIIEFPDPLLPREWRRPGSTFIEAPEIVRILHRDLVPFAARHPFAPLPPRDALSMECKLSELLARLGRARRLGRELPVPPWLARVRDRLDVEAEIPSSLTDLAREVGVHPSHLARAFRDHYGRTIGSHLRLQRLRVAHARLTASEDSLSEIAVRAGFADQAHFTRAFSNRWGVSPGRYRQSLRLTATASAK